MLFTTEPGETTLDSVGVTSTPQVPTYTYTFTLRDGCEGFLDGFFDQNGDDALTESDLGAWPGVNADLNLDNATSSADFALLVQGLIQRSALP